jgi:hypothetical protein
MTVLIIGVAERQAIDAAVERAAAKPVSLARVKRAAQTVPQEPGVLSLADRGDTLPPPEREIVRLQKYQACITFEEQPIGLCRHLSVSVETPGRLPHMLAVGMIAEAFGFVPGMKREIWVEEFEPGHHAVNVVEPVMPSSRETRQ